MPNKTSRIKDDNLYHHKYSYLIYTLYKALLVSIGDDCMHLSIIVGKGVVKSLL